MSASVASDPNVPNLKSDVDASAAKNAKSATDARRKSHVVILLDARLAWAVCRVRGRRDWTLSINWMLLEFMGKDVSAHLATTYI